MNAAAHASIGQNETREDVVAEPHLRAVAATLDEPWTPTDGLPPLWHWTMFQNWAPYSGLRPDGGARADGFLPQLPDLPRRMAAGSRVAFHRPLKVGDHVTQVNTVHDLRERQGSSGSLCILTVERRISGPEGLAITEHQDVVYLEDKPRRPTDARPGGPLPDTAVIREREAGAVVLFRYSAMTANSHRIHYDYEYARSVEGYPGLVVHGPLQASWLAAHARTLRPGARLASIAFRNTHPAFHSDTLSFIGWTASDGHHLQVRDGRGVICMTASATFET